MVGVERILTILTNSSKPRKVPTNSRSPRMIIQILLPMHLSTSSRGRICGAATVAVAAVIAAVAILDRTWSARTQQPAKIVNRERLETASAIAVLIKAVLSSDIDQIFGNQILARNTYHKIRVKTSVFE